MFRLGAGEPEQLWKTKKLRTQMNPAVLFQGHLFGVDGNTTDKAALKCLDFATGDEKWAHPNFGSGARNSMRSSNVPPPSASDTIAAGRW